jgi:CBS domain-containing protein
MEIVGRGKRVQIFLDERDSVHGRALYTAILERLRAEGAAGATVIRGIAGYGAHSRIHSAHLADLAAPLPLVITWVDAPDRVERLLPAICALVTEGLVTVEDVNIVKYSHRDLPALAPTLRVRDLMTRTVTAVQPDTPLGEVVERLLAQELRAVPVVDADGRVVGIVTNGDLVERGGLPARMELLAAMAPAARQAVLAQAPAELRARDVMTPAPVTIAADAPLAEAAAVMARRGLKRLPVVDAEGHLLGIISRVDVLRAFAEGYPAPENGAPAAAGPQVPVGQLMSRHVPVVRADARLAEVLDVVVSTRLNRAVVIDAAGHPLGVISDADVLRRLDPRWHPGVLGVLMRQQRIIPPEAARITATEMMRAPALTVTEDTPAVEAMRRMLEASRKVLVVVDARGVLRGIIDRAHLLAAAGAAGPPGERAGYNTSGS